MCYIVTDKEKSQAAKSYLSKIASTDALITQLQGLVCELRGQLNGQNYTLNPDKVQTSGPKDNMTAIIDKIVDLKPILTEILINLLIKSGKLLN